MDIKKAFAAVELKARKKLITVSELRDEANVSRATYWRATNDKHKNPDATIRVLRLIKEALERLEKLK